MNDNSDHYAPAPPTAPAWLLIQTRPSAERRVVTGLRLRLSEGSVYLPMETVWRGAVKRKVPYSRPLIPGYVFARLASADLPALHEIAGVQRLVMVDGRPAIIDPRFVETLMVAELAGRFDKTRAPRGGRGSVRQLGDRVRIARGVGEGFVGVVTRLTSKRRVEVLLAIATRPVTVELSDLEAADDAPSEADRAAA